MTHEQLFAINYWRANVGRLPRGCEGRLVSMCLANNILFVVAVRVVVERGFRRTADRWRLFLAMFGEAP